MVFAVGLTGNIASGKTTAAKIFARFGIEIISADAVSRVLTAKNTPAYQEIVAHYGADIVLESGELNRQQMRDIIFSNPHERQWLEDLLHPLIRKQLEEQVSLCTTPYCIVEIPLLLYKKYYPYLNKILLISAPQKEQLARVMERDHCSKTQALSILAAQPDEHLRLENADDVVINDSGLDVLKHHLEKLHRQYLNDIERNPV